MHTSRSPGPIHSLQHIALFWTLLENSLLYLHRCPITDADMHCTVYQSLHCHYAWWQCINLGNIQIYNPWCCFIVADILCYFSQTEHIPNRWLKRIWNIFHPYASSVYWYPFTEWWVAIIVLCSSSEIWDLPLEVILAVKNWYWFSPVSIAESTSDWKD